MASRLDLVQQQQRFSLIAFVLVEFGIFYRRADSRRDQCQNVLLVRREIIRLAAFYIQYADYAAAHNQRHRQFRPYAVECVEIPRIPAHITHANRLAGSRRRADNSLAHRNSPVVHNFLPMSDGKPEIHLVRAFFGQQHGEHLVVNQALDERRRIGQHLVQIQRCVDLLADLRQNRERLRRNLNFRIEFCRIHMSKVKTSQPPPRKSCPHKMLQPYSIQITIITGEN